jgi:hypothetical protein
LIFAKVNPGQLWEHHFINPEGASTVKTNVGNADRIVRIVAGLALIGLAVAGTIGPWGYIGVVLLLTGFLRVCPAYSLLDFNTGGTGKG